MDEMDFYLGTRMKNWAAAHQPPAGGRIRLLRAASSAPVQRDRLFVRFLSYIKMWFTIDQDIYSEGDFYLGSITQARALFYPFATDMRLAN